MERLTGATRGSAGVDLATAADITLDNDKVQVLPSTTNGPLGYGLSALLIGRSSTSKQGIFVLPGLIDADYTGNIGIMARALHPPVRITAGTRIAQLIPFKGCVPKTSSAERGAQGFGSTGPPQIAFAMEVTARRPVRTVRLQGLDGRQIIHEALLDTGADVTIIPSRSWPESWPLQNVTTPVVGVGGTQLTRLSANFITVIDLNEPNNTAKVRPYVMPTSIWLLGRDCLSQWGLTLQTSPFA